MAGIQDGSILPPNHPLHVWEIGSNRIQSSPQRPLQQETPPVELPTSYNEPRVYFDASSIGVSAESPAEHPTSYNESAAYRGSNIADSTAYQFHQVSLRGGKEIPDPEDEAREQAKRDEADNACSSSLLPSPTTFPTYRKKKTKSRCCPLSHLICWGIFGLIVISGLTCLGIVLGSRNSSKAAASPANKPIGSGATSTVADETPSAIPTTVPTASATSMTTTAESLASPSNAASSGGTATVTVLTTVNDFSPTTTDSAPRAPSSLGPDGPHTPDGHGMNRRIMLT